MKSNCQLMLVALGLVALVGFAAQAAPVEKISSLEKVDYVLDMLKMVARKLMVASHLSYRDLEDAYAEVRVSKVKPADFGAFELLNKVAFKPMASREISSASGDDEKRAFVDRVEERFVELYNQKS